MLEIILIAVIGSVLAGIWDLRTTEVPDHLPIGMVVIGIVYWILNGVITGNWYPFTVSIIVGTALLAIGLVMYKKGQWGGADAWILAAIGYMIPVYQGIFIVPYLLNFMIVSIAYTVVYSVVIGLMNKKVFRYVAEDFRKSAKIIIGVPLGLALIILVIATSMPEFIVLLVKLVPLIFLLLLFWRYAVVIEKRVFRKRIPVSKLKKGDVLEGSNWVGLTEKEVKKIRSQKRFVVIKDGMRFVPVFAIALVLTLLFGNLFFIFLV